MSNVSQDNNEEASVWKMGVFDAHCHPTQRMHLVEQIPTMKAAALTVMATRAQDQELVVQIAKRYAMKIEDLSTSDSSVCRVTPAFGWHPWNSHEIFDDTLKDGSPKSLDNEAKIAHYQAVLNPPPADKEFMLALADPQPLSDCVADTKRRLEEFPTALVGEVGLDKAFRIPEAWLPGVIGNQGEGRPPGGREGRKLSPYHVDMDHQKKILTAQLQLAGDMQRSASVHGVQAHGVLYETLHTLWKGHERASRRKRDKRRSEIGILGNAGTQDDPSNTTFPPRICLHSYSGPVDTTKQYLHASVPIDFYFSFSMVVNFSTAAASKTEKVIKALPDDRILVESDLHAAGERMDAALEAVVKKVCELKQWSFKDGALQLAANWKRFIFGDSLTTEQ